MGRLRFLTAGESHGPALTALVEGLPGGLALPSDFVNAQLWRRQQGYGRGGRQRIERDRVRYLGGVRFGVTTGAPLSMVIENLDFASWRDEMAPEGPSGVSPLMRGPAVRKRPVRVPRPGHADLAGGVKYGVGDDLRDVLERASARETAARVAAGAAARRLLEECGVAIFSRVLSIGDARDDAPIPELRADELNALADASPVRALLKDAEAAMVAAIQAAMRAKETLGGVFEVRARGVPIGLGSHVQWDRKLDGRLGQAFLSIQAVKGVEIGDGWEVARGLGSRAHDEMEPREGGGVRRKTNRAGGLEGGITNGEEVIVRAAMKPLSTLPRPLSSVDWKTGAPAAAHVERTDTCAVPAAAVIGEAMLALVLADALLEKLGGDSMSELLPRLRAWREESEHRPKPSTPGGSPVADGEDER